MPVRCYLYIETARRLVWGGRVGWGILNSNTLAPFWHCGFDSGVSGIIACSSHSLLVMDPAKEMFTFLACHMKPEIK